MDTEVTRRLGVNTVRVLDVVNYASGSVTLSDVVAATGLRYKTCAMILRRLEDKGLVIKPARGQWLGLS